ncbi:hypothetical protein [Clostridium sp.]|uniref:hypothetical protein n=1 Tax=Clostridium sp. TaxID=1506 RepID=UPI003F352353
MNKFILKINGEEIECTPCSYEELFGEREVYDFECPICGRNAKGLVCYHDDKLNDKWNKFNIE